MRYITAAVVGAVMSAGAAQAAVYQYDVAMELELESLHLAGASYYGTGPIPDYLTGKSCVEVSDGFDFRCGPSDVDITTDRLGIAEAAIYEPIITSSLLLDTEYGGNLPSCEGPSFICDRVNISQWDDLLRYSATPVGFDIIAPTGLYNFEVSSEGVSFIFDQYLSGIIGTTIYSQGWLRGNYSTTSLEITEIAPVPLPASLPLLTVGVAAFGWISRRRSS